METSPNPSSSPNYTIHPRPPAAIFRSNIGSGRDTVAYEDGHELPIVDKIDYHTSGGIFLYVRGELYPRKGFPFPEVVFATNTAKRMIVSVFKFLASPLLTLPLLGFLIMPWYSKRKLILHALGRFQEAADVILGPYYLQDRFWMLPAKELNNFVTLFFRYLGIETRLGDILAMTLEYDTAYCLRFQDIMGCTDAEKMSNPRKEIQRLFDIYCQREPDPLIKAKFGTFVKLIRLVLLVPRIKKAFLKTIKEVNIENFWFTEADEYHILSLNGYNFDGKTYLERIEMFVNIHQNRGVPVPHAEYMTQRPKTEEFLLVKKDGEGIPVR